MGNRVLNWQSGIARNRSECDPRYQHLWDGLVGAWYPKLGPTGVTLRDVSGHHNHGVLTNMDPATDWVLGEDGWALDTDATNDHVLIPHSSSLDVQTGDMTAIIQLRFNAVPGDGMMLAKGINTHDTYTWTLGYWHHGWGIYWALYNGSNNPSANNSGAPPIVGTTYQIVGVKTGNNISLYINGEHISTVAGCTLLSSTEDICINKKPKVASEYVNAEYDLAALYSGALSAAEIMRLYETRGNCLLAKPDYGWLYGAQEEGLTALPGLASSSPSAFDPTALPGAISTLPGLAVSNPAAYQATGVPGVVVISPGYAESIAAAFDATGVPGIVAVTPGLAMSSPSAYDPTAAPGAVSALAGYAESIAAALDAQGIAGTVTVLPGLASHASAAYQASATIPGSGQTIYPGLASRVAAAFEVATVNAPTGLRHTLVLVDTRDVLLLVDTCTVLQIVDERDTLRLV